MMPDAQQWWLFAELMSIVLVGVAVLSLAGLPVMAVSGQFMSRLRQRSSYDKCARQLAVLAAILGWPLLLGGAWLLWLRLRPFVESAQVVGQDGMFSVPALSSMIYATVQVQADGLVWMALSVGVLLTNLYAVLWRTLRTVPVLHQALGLLGALCSYAASYGLMAVIAADAAFELGEPRAVSLYALFLPPQTSPLWNGLSYLLPLTLSMAGAMGALWLVIRRHRDDYGRDHYNSMVPWCAAFARTGWLVLWLLLVGFTGLHLWYQALDSTTLPLQDLIRPAVQLLLWLIPGLLWAIVARSEAPMRHKLTLVLALILSLGFAATVYLGLIVAL